MPSPAETKLLKNHPALIGRVSIFDVKCGMPYLTSGAPADAFAALRLLTIEEAGYDFLSVCGDMMRPADFVSTKDGVANRSWHKTGRAFDYNQADKNIKLVREDSSMPKLTYWRTFIKCKDQSGKRGSIFSGLGAKIFWFDFTAAAHVLGFERIPAWNGWEKNWNRREFWHYEMRQGLTWNEAMASLYTDQIPPKRERILGVNDRGADVALLQRELLAIGFLKAADGVFGPQTKTAVVRFQLSKGLTADGLVGPRTRRAIQSEVARKRRVL